MTVVAASVSVYQRSAHYFIHANLKTRDGLWIASLPAELVSSETTPMELGEAVRRILDGASGSSSGAPVTNPKERQSHLLEVARVRSWATLQRTASLCSVYISDQGVLVEPSRNGGAYGEDRGFTPLTDEAMCLSPNASTHDLGDALVAAFTRCC
jgi:hypothetical protein